MCSYYLSAPECYTREGAAITSSLTRALGLSLNVAIWMFRIQARGARPNRPSLHLRTRRPLLALQELVKHYDANGAEPVKAVDGVNLEVQRGEMVALYGPSGSGKTTLLLMVATLLEPTSGSITIAGRRCRILERERGLELPARRARVH